MNIESFYGNTRSTTRITARALTGITYAVLGFDVVKSPGGRVEQAAGTLATLRRVVDIPLEDASVVRLNGAVQAAAGTMLAFGLWPRTSAVVLVGSLVPTTLAGHSFWKYEDHDMRKRQQIQFCKNMTMIGGLLFAALDRRPARSLS